MQTIRFNKLNLKSDDLVLDMGCGEGRHTIGLFVEKDSNAKLLIAGGDGGEEWRLKQQIIDLNLQKSVFLIGPVDFDDKNIELSHSAEKELLIALDAFGRSTSIAASKYLPHILCDHVYSHNLSSRFNCSPTCCIKRGAFVFNIRSISVMINIIFIGFWLIKHYC